MAAPTTAALATNDQHSQESIARLAARYDLNAKTVAKWRKRTTVEDADGGRASRTRRFSTQSKRPSSFLPSAHPARARRLSVRSASEYSTSDPLQPPSLLQRHGISRLPEVEVTSRRRRRLLNTPSATSILILPKFIPAGAALSFRRMTARQSSLRRATS